MKFHLYNMTYPCDALVGWLDWFGQNISLPSETPKKESVIEPHTLSETL